MNDLGIQRLVPRHFPISVEMYHVMAERGAFEPTDRVELIEGELFETSPIGTLHARCVDYLSNFLNRAFSGRMIIRVQSPIIVADESEPQPDISVLRFRDDFYKDAHPAGNDVLLIIEAADTSVEFDRSRKLPLYAAAGIPETWLVDLAAEHVEVHSEPKESTYGKIRVYQRGEEVISETLPGLKPSVNEVLG